MVQKTEYLQNPCETLATAYWKDKYFKKPAGFRIALESNLTGDNARLEKGTRYFRLIHHLSDCQKPLLPEGYAFKNVLLQGEAELVADTINKCYDGYSQTVESVLEWTKYPVFDNNIWIWAWDNIANVPAALGIADFDSDINEGSLEWIQVLPNYRGKGFGEAVTLELLFRFSKKADFVTVSGEVENITNPERLYRKCGFTGEAVWIVSVNDVDTA